MSTLPAPLKTALSDHYLIERELGQGGMATVYLARDLKHDRQVALKVLRPELGAVLGAERFLAEIKITARLDHPHILTLIDSGAAEGFLYYVLPFVRGESLRDLLNRDKQLGIEEALTITKQVAGALDYAHRQGVVHRDIKPENILIQEGEAMLADFGIALAVKEAGGNRLTETGLSLGTPQYMSPEQATGDRLLDARSDVYSLAAVLYEMLTGEPPMTGPTVQAVIAKLLTEMPTRIRTVRNTVSDGVDDAVFKALAKVPADRFPSAGDFARALSAPAATASVPSAQGPTRRVPAAALIGGLAVVVALGGLLATRSLGRTPAAPVALRDRTQLTFTGQVRAPALSPDGKQLAYFVQNCAAAGSCSYAVDVQDVGATTTRRVLEGASAAYGLEWSPDRRNLILYVTIGGRWGTYLLSALGGPPRYLTAGVATFYAGGDSLLIGPSGADSVFSVRVAALNGAIHDSILVPGPGLSLAGLSVVPGSSRIVALVIQGSHGLWQVLDRAGKVTDRLVNSCTCGGTASQDALWMTRAGPTVSEAVVRVAIDPATGRLASRQDTVYAGSFTGVSVTADGTQMAVDDGSYAYNVWALSLPDLLHGRFPAGAPLLQASSPVGANVSPDGRLLLLRRTLPAAGGVNEARLSVTPFGGGPESPIAVAGRVIATFWADSVTLAISSQTPGGLHLALVDARSGAARNPLDLPDSAVAGITPLPAGWAWIPSSRDRIVVEQDGRRTEIPKPAWFSNLNGVNASPDGRRLAYVGWNTSTEDSLRVDVVPVEGGTATPWTTSFAERGGADWLADGSLLFRVWTGQETVALLRLPGPGQVEHLGTVPHAAGNISVSRDLKRATLGWNEYHGDAWLYRVVRP